MNQHKKPTAPALDQLSSSPCCISILPPLAPPLKKSRVKKAKSRAATAREGPGSSLRQVAKCWAAIAAVKVAGKQRCQESAGRAGRTQIKIHFPVSVPGGRGKCELIKSALASGGERLLPSVCSAALPGLAAPVSSAGTGEQSPAWPCPNCSSLGTLGMEGLTC